MRAQKFYTNLLKLVFACFSYVSFFRTKNIALWFQFLKSLVNKELVKHIANAVSFIFHPLFIITYLLLLLILINPYLFSIQNPRDMGVLVIYIILLTIAFPGITIVMMRVLGFVNSFHLYERKDRIVPLIFTSAFYLWLFVNIYQNPTVPVAFTIFVLGITLSLFLVFFFNLFVKISLHATGVGGLLTAIVLIKYYFSYDQFSISVGNTDVYLISTTLLIFIAILSAGMVGTSRLVLKAHSPGEVLGGYFVGILSQMIAFQFLFE